MRVLYFVLYASLEIRESSSSQGLVAGRPVYTGEGDLSGKAAHASPLRCGDFFAELDEAAFSWWATDGAHQRILETSLAQKTRRGDEKELLGDVLCDKMVEPAGPVGWKHPVHHRVWYMRPFYFDFDVGNHTFRVPLRRRESEKACELVTTEDLSNKLFRCAYKGQTNRLRTCLRAGARINAIDVNHPARLSPVLWAACGGCPRTLEALAELGADFEARDVNGAHALHLAAARGHVQAAAAVYQITDGNLYARDNQQRLALHLACLEGHAEVVELLVDLGTNVNAKDHSHDSPLHLACINGHVETTRKLLWLGADPWQQNFMGQMPIDIAEQHGRKGVYDLLERVVGEKCIFDRLPDSMLRCGQRHPDEPVELYHRVDPADLAPYAVGADESWSKQDELGSKPASQNLTGLTAQDIYNNPKVWEATIRAQVDMFPGTSVQSTPGPRRVNAVEETSGTASAQSESGGDSIPDWDEEWITHGQDPTRF